MCPIFFIGLGLHINGISKIGQEIANKSDFIYLDAYTSPLSNQDISSIQKLIKKKVKIINREFLEDSRTILNQAKQNDVSLLVYGDPMIATTHTEIRIRAERSGIKTRVIHNSSILSALSGETGLHAYNFGKPVTITNSASTPKITAYEVIYQNLIRNLHTIVLLEYDYSNNFFLSPNQGLESLLKTEKDLKYGIFDFDTFIIVASRIGNHQSMKGGKLRGLLKKNFGEPPHALIIPGKLHFTEVDSLKTILKINGKDISDNSLKAKPIGFTMVNKYVKNARDALSKARSKGEQEGKIHLENLFENVDCYLSDAERFLNQGKYELAILSIGYAEGLLDALRFIGELEIRW
jgi:diphthine synthase